MNLMILVKILQSFGCKLQPETMKDRELQKLQKVLDTGKWGNHDKDIQPYKNCMDKVSAGLVSGKHITVINLIMKFIVSPTERWC